MNPRDFLRLESFLFLNLKIKYKRANPARMYHIVLSEAVISILKVKVLNPNAKMLFFLFPSSGHHTTMEQVNTDTYLWQGDQGVPGPLSVGIPVDFVH